jgi:hypothetical protein
MNTQTRNAHSTNNWTRVASMCIIDSVIRFADIKERLSQQYDADYEYLEKNYEEQNRLLAQVRKFNDLEREAKVRRARAARIIAALGEQYFSDREEDLKRKRSSAKGIYFDTEEVPLWGVMAAIVEQVPEIQVVDLQAALEYFGRKASRQAIESALASHKETFETKVRSREKFVSLKR